MTWVIEHIGDLFAIVGAVYTIGRTVVYLTPSTSDDVDFENKVGKPLKMLAALLGLSLDQGRKLSE